MIKMVQQKVMNYMQSSKDKTFLYMLLSFVLFIAIAVIGVGYTFLKNGG